MNTCLRFDKQTCSCHPTYSPGRTMSEVSQLNEMHAVLITSKEDNFKKRHEAAELTEKIKELEVNDSLHMMFVYGCLRSQSESVINLTHGAHKNRIAFRSPQRMFLTA